MCSNIARKVVTTRFFQTYLSSTKLLSSSYKFYTTTSFDPYSVLGVARDADEATVKNAYIKLAKLYHPDRNPDDDEAKEKFIKIQNSYRQIMEKISVEEEFGKIISWFI